MALKGTISTNDYLGRYYTLSWSAVQSIEKNQSTIYWNVSCDGRNGEWFAERTLQATLAGVTLVNKTDRVQRYNGNVASGSFTVNHDSNGYLTITGQLRVAVYTSSVNCTASGSWTLDSIPRQAILLTAQDFYDDENPTITYKNQAGSSVTDLSACISFDGKSDDIPYRSLSLDETSYTFELTESERDALLTNTLDGSNSREVVFFVRTVIGGNTLYSTMKKRFTVRDAKPTIEPTVRDTNPATLAITNGSGIFIRYYSNAEIKINAKAYKKASIVSEKAICGSKSISADSGTINGIDSGSIVFNVSDNRGNVVSSVKQVPLIEYFNVTCDLVANPSDAEGKLKFSVKGKFYNNSFGETSNTLTLQCCYSEDDGEYTAWVDILNVSKNGNQYSAETTISGLDYRKKYEIRVRAKDLLSEAVSTSKALRTIPIFDWGQNDFVFNVGVAIKKALQLENKEGIFGKDTDGNPLALLQTNGNNQVAVGYGSYEKKIGASYLYGNNVSVVSNGDIRITSPTAGLDNREYGVNKVLASTESYMNASQTIELNEAISAQPNGIVLVWSLYDFVGGDGAYDYGWVQHFVPKYMVTNLAGAGSYFTLTTNDFDYVCSKYLYIHDKKIVGHENNSVNSKSSYSGITYTNRAWVLRYVIGV